MENNSLTPLVKIEMQPFDHGIELHAQKDDPGAQEALSKLMLWERENVQTVGADAEQATQRSDCSTFRRRDVPSNPMDWVRFRIHCPDHQRWFELLCKDPMVTGADIKKKLFHATGVHPFYARLWYQGNPLRNDVFVRDLPFQNFIEEGDAGLILSVCIAVDDNNLGMECEVDEETPAMKLRAGKPPVYPRAKSMILTDWAVSNAQAKCALAQQDLKAKERELDAANTVLEETRFRASQCLAKGALEQNDLIKKTAEKRRTELGEAEASNKRVVLFFHDLCRYLFLLVFFQIALYCGPNGNTAIFDILATYQNSYKVSSNQVVDVEKFWDYNINQFIEMTVPSESYAGRPYAPLQMNWTLDMNYLVGDLQMRQIRTAVDRCSIRTEYLDSINHCYAAYRESLSAAPAAFGPDHQYRYIADAGGMATGLSGKLGIDYPKEGYVVYIPKNASKAKALLQDMKQNMWIDSQTRAVVTSWLVYNPSIDLYITTSIIYEFPSYGSVIVDQKFGSLQPIRYEGTGVLVLVIEVIVICQVLFNIFREAQVISKDFDSSLSSYWDFVRQHDPARAMDWGNYTLCIVVFCIRIRNVVATQKLHYDSATREVVGLYELITWYEVDVFIQAINCVQMWLKAFKFINIFHTAAIFTEMYGKAFFDLLQFTYMFFTLNIIFAQAGMMFYGQRSIYFVTIMDSLYSLFWMLTGKLSAFDLDKISPGWGSLFYILYMVMQIFLFLNYVFGVFSFALRATVYAARPEKYLGFFIRNYIAAEWAQFQGEIAWMKFWERSKQKKSAGLLHKENQDTKLNLKPQDLFVSPDEFLCMRDARNHYKKCFGDEELELVLAEIDLYQTGLLDKKQVHNLLEKTCAKLELTDMSSIPDAPLTDWDPIVDPLIFDVIEGAQLKSRNTMFSDNFFSSLRFKMKSDI